MKHKLNISGYDIVDDTIMIYLSQELAFERIDEIITYHQVEWDARGFSSRIYFYIIQTGMFNEVRKMILLKYIPFSIGRN